MEFSSEIPGASHRYSDSGLEDERQIIVSRSCDLKRREGLPSSPTTFFNDQKITNELQN
jgi:hypothetical protein